MRKACLLLVFLCFKQTLSAQTYEFLKKCTPAEAKDFLGLTKKVFRLNNNFSYGLSNSDAKKNFKDIDNQVLYNDAYLEKKLKELKKDSINPLTLNDVAMYYEVNLKAEQAQTYFKKSFDNLSYFVKTQKDSAKFYSYRGYLKYHLGEKNAIADIEKALQKNPEDSLAMITYPVFLLNDQRFDDLKKFTQTRLDNNTKNPSFYFVMLFSGSFWETISMISSDESKKAEFALKDYDQMKYYDLFRLYGEKYKSDVEMQNVRNMIDVTALFLKVACFKPKPDFSGVIFNFTEKDKVRIKELQAYFNDALNKKQINFYSGYKSLSTLNYFQDKTDAAIEYAKKAIAVFPEAKKSNNFNSDEMYNSLLLMYNFQNKFTDYKIALEAKIKSETDKSQLPADYMNMALLYLYDKNIDKADEWCKKSKALDPESFECLRLLAHLFYLNDSISLSQFYGESASKHMQSNNDSAWLSLQFAIYMISNGNNEVAKTAHENLMGAKKGLNGDCPICDELAAKYIKITP